MKRKNDNMLVFLAILSIICLLIFTWWAINTDINKLLQLREQKNKAKVEVMYKAWCKETGNEKHLTLEEFKILKVKNDFLLGTPSLNK